ncbi:MAG: D-alanyl-D-alanine carboxypeptidase, partial [Desulfovibrio sp.]|nr:D-alanyl-D-alanine carboxypeptidase [Desulfovibrio sp.]
MHVLILLLTLLWPQISEAQNLTAPQAIEPQEEQISELNVNSAILYDLNTNKILFEQNADEPIQPASLTKIMSMFLALDRISQGRATFDTRV